MRKVYRFELVRAALLLLLAAPLFVALCAGLLVQRPDSLAVWIVAGAGILLFGGGFVIGLVCLPRARRSNEALVLTPQGIALRPLTQRDATLIEWEEIAALSDFYVRGERFIVLHLRDPKRRIECAQGRLKRLAMKINTKLYGSPYSISTAAIRCDSDRLAETLVRYLEKYGRPDEAVGKN